MLTRDQCLFWRGFVTGATVSVVLCAYDMPIAAGFLATIAISTCASVLFSLLDRLVGVDPLAGACGEETG